MSIEMYLDFFEKTQKKRRENCIKCRSYTQVLQGSTMVTVYLSSRDNG